MRIRVLTSREGHPCGAEVDIDDLRAQAWIDAGDAEALPSIIAPVETAMASVPETAMRETAKRNK